MVPRVFTLMTDQEGEGSGVQNKLLGRQNLAQNLGFFLEEKRCGVEKSWQNLTVEQQF